METERSSVGRYALRPIPINSEDILFCIDLIAESQSETKMAGPSSHPSTRLDSIKRALLLFIHAKLTINPDHRFAFLAFANSASWVRREFSSHTESLVSTISGLSAGPEGHGPVDITQIFQAAAYEAGKSRARGRALRMILIYCRSASPPHCQLKKISRKLFTLDVVYLHEKPGPGNCPQMVYDVLVGLLEGLSEYEGYIFECGHRMARLLSRHLSILLSHPQQRCVQDDFDAPKPLLAKRLPDTGPPDQAVELAPDQSRSTYS